MNSTNSLDSSYRRSDLHRIKGQGIVHAPPEVTFDCISDLDSYYLWDGLSSERKIIAEYTTQEWGLVRIVYIRFKGIFPLSARDVCMCTCKKIIYETLKSQSSINTCSFSHTIKSYSSNMNGPVYILAAFSISHPNCPPVPGFVRAEVAASGFIIRPYGTGSCSQVTYITQFDAKGWLPHKVANLVSQYQPVQIAQIRDIVREYYNQNLKKKPSIIEINELGTQSPSRFIWLQSCRLSTREEEDFISSERKKLEYASSEKNKELKIDKLKNSIDLIEKPRDIPEEQKKIELKLTNSNFHLEEQKKNIQVSDSKNNEIDDINSDGDIFFDFESEIDPSEIIKNPFHKTYIKVIENDLDYLKMIYDSSQEKLQLLENLLKQKSNDIEKISNLFDGLKFTINLSDKTLKNISSHQKKLELDRNQFESRWKTKIESILSKLIEAEQGYWRDRKSRKAALRRWSFFFFLFLFWPIISIWYFSILKQPPIWLLIIKIIKTNIRFLNSNRN